MESMTGYGRGEASSSGLQVRLQIGAVNHRHCDIRFSMARELGFLEKPLRDRLREQLHRGSLSVSLDVTITESLPGRLHVDTELAREYYQQAEGLRRALSMDVSLGLADLLQIPEIVTVRNVEAPPEALIALALQAADQALEGLLAMRRSEGAAMLADLRQRTATVTSHLDRIAELAPTVPEQYRERLSQRLTELLDEPSLDEDRLAKEVAWLADKADISEEITRLRCHLDHLRLLLDDDGPVGRKLDFLLQEMNREVNTIGSKANDQAIATLVVELKTELERLREQVQNVQ